MTDCTDAIAQALFNKPSLQACSRQQVDYLAHQYPYFNAAQLLLLQKAAGNADAYAAQLQRTALQVAHPLQLQYWLHPADFEAELPEAKLFEKPISAKRLQEVTIPKEPEADAGDPAEVKAEDAPETGTVVQVEADAESKIPKLEPALAETTLPEVFDKTMAVSASENITSAEAAPITFEPYHTVDYFASQGIKLSQQEATNDTLGKQLKSFTEWLKTMKRLPEAAGVQTGDSAGERKVEHLAAHSLDTSEIVTESMAEVWLKQGNLQKAAEVYNKLSLRNPAKSAYFAAKIESLKQS